MGPIVPPNLGREGRWNEFFASFLVDPDAGRLNALAKTISAAIDSDKGSTLFVEGTGVFPSSEDVLLEQLVRRGLGETRSVREAPGCFFDAGEGELCRTIVHVCLINFWDFSLVSSESNLWVRGSHDECIDLCSLEQDAFQRTCAAFQALGLKEISTDKA